MATQIKNGQKILFIGDSITDCGARIFYHRMAHRFTLHARCFYRLF